MSQASIISVSNFTLMLEDTEILHYNLNEDEIEILREELALFSIRYTFDELEMYKFIERIEEEFEYFKKLEDNKIIAIGNNIIDTRSFRKVEQFVKSRLKD